MVWNREVGGQIDSKDFFENALREIVFDAVPLQNAKIDGQAGKLLSFLSRNFRIGLPPFCEVPPFVSVHQHNRFFASEQPYVRIGLRAQVPPTANGIEKDI